MAVESTTLANILSRMNRYQDVSTVEEKFKVQDIDEAIRTLRRSLAPPWTIKKTTLKLLHNVLIYSVESDHQQLALLERQLEDGSSFQSQADVRARYTSLEQFYQNDDGRNKIAEIWDGSEKFLGVRYDDFDFGTSLASGNDPTDYTAGSDASSPTAETVQTIDNSDTVKFTVTNSIGVASMTETIAAISDTNYLKKFYTRWVYLDAVPTSIQLRFGNDADNYLPSPTLTTQFSGQAFKADDWNLLSYDLNDSTVVGTIDADKFDYATVVLNGAATGTYFLGNAYLRGWDTLDYFYYSFFNVKSSSSSVLDKNFFIGTDDSFDTSDSLVAEPAWVDVITLDAILSSLADNKNTDVINSISKKREDAWLAIQRKYPDMAPVIISQRYNFNDSPNLEHLSGTDILR